MSTRHPILLAWLVLGSAALVGGAISASAAVRAIAAHQEVRFQDVPPITAGYEAEDHFPGAALFYAVADERASDAAVASQAAPAPGTTGTAPLPAMPVPANALPAETVGMTVVPALPFSTAIASTLDRGRALECLTAAIYYEAASESDDGQRAVAQVILNRVRHPAFPHTVCGVVYQGSENAGCQFSFACDGAMARAASRSGWARAMRIAADALAGQVFAPVGLATHYHTYAVTPTWNRALVMTDAIGAHFFHRWKGWWGTPAAFTQRYVGGEPVPGPHPRAFVPAVAMPMLLASVGAPVTLPVPVTTAAAVQPEHVGSGELQAATADDAIAAGQILDKWKDSGKPLR